MESTENDQTTSIPKASRKKTMLKKNIGICNQELLKLVARGSAIICEILRLKDYIPEPYCNKQEEKLYKDIIFDFSLFKPGAYDKFEAKLKSDQELLDKDEDFRANNIELIERFFSLFDSIYQYITDWGTFIDQVNNGKFVQHTIDTILSNKEMRPLFCESIFNMGVMLLLVDRLIEGHIREKLIVSYYRYKGQSTIPHFEDIYKLFSFSDYTPPSNFSDAKDEKKPKKYPVDYFKRCKVNPDIVKKIVGTISGNDIYDHLLAYPTSNEYQTTALSQQASLLVVILFFNPKILEKEQKIMIDIVNRHFHDNFVVSFYMGYTIDLNEYWKEFKEAHNALEFNMKSSILKDKKSENLKKISVLDNNVKEYLNEGVMTEEYVLKNIEKLLDLMRESNSVLRWFILQRTITNKKLRDLFNEKLEDKSLLNLLLDLSQFEYLIRTMFQNLVFNKDEMWDNDKSTCTQKLSELICYFSGNSAFNSNVKYENYSNYFEGVSKKINDLTTKNPTKAGIKIGKIKDMINGIKSLDKISESVNAKENLRIINEKLDHMLLLVNVKVSYLANISKISDFSYAWIIIHDYANEMQNLLRKDSKNVLLLRATFLKLASILNFPLIRLFEIESEDIESVTNYYSGELVKFVKYILQVIPKSVFELLEDICKIFESGFKDLPIKLMKANVKDYTQTEERYKLAKNVHGISLITRGIFLMEKTLMGVIEVDPKVILEEGIRTELLNLLAKTFNSYIDFGVDDKINLLKKLDKLIVKINAVKKSFIYIQDYIGINGSKMWCEEMHRLINYYVLLEANKFLLKKIKPNKNEQEEMTKYKIPSFEPLKNAPESYTFLGRLVRYVINLTNSKNSTFCLANSTWYEKDRLDKEVFSIKVLNKIKNAIGVEGFQGFGKLLSYLNYQNLLSLNNYYNSKILAESKESSSSSLLKQIARQYGSPFVTNNKSKNLSKDILHNIKNFSKNTSGKVVDFILEIGQIEFLRKLYNYILSTNAEVECYILDTQLKAMDKINLLTLEKDLKINLPEDQAINPEDNKIPNPNKNNNLYNYFQNLCSYLEDFGYNDTQHTFYHNLMNLQFLPILLAASTFITMKNYFSYDEKNMELSKKAGESFDLIYYTHGIYCVIYQMGRNNIITFIGFMSDILKLHFLKPKSKKDKKDKKDKENLKKETVKKDMGNSNPEINKHITFIQLFLQELACVADINLDYFEINMNNYIMFRNLAKSFASKA